MANFRVGRSASKINLTTIFFDLDNTLIETRKGDSLACRKVRHYQLFSLFSISPSSLYFYPIDVLILGIVNFCHWLHQFNL